MAFWDRGVKRAVWEETWKDILEARRFESKHKSLQSQPRSRHVRNPMGFLRHSISVHLIQLCWWKCGSPHFISWCSTTARVPHKPSSRNTTYGACWNSTKKHVASTCIPDVYAWQLREHLQVAFIFVLIILFKCCFYNKLKRNQFTQKYLFLYEIENSKKDFLLTFNVFCISNSKRHSTEWIPWSGYTQPKYYEFKYHMFIFRPQTAMYNPLFNNMYEVKIHTNLKNSTRRVMDSINKLRYLKPLYRKDGASLCYSEESAGRNSFLILAEGQPAQLQFPKQAFFPWGHRCTWSTSIACMTFPYLSEHMPVSLICLLIIWNSSKC